MGLYLAQLRHERMEDDFLPATGKESSGVTAKAVLFLNKGSMRIYSDPYREGPLLSVLS